MKHKIKVIENIFIPISPGLKLAAKIWLPVNAEQVPVPALLEYEPYRKRDATAECDQYLHPYFAEQGYASVRVDIRGSGESDGLLLDEYSEQEQNDCMTVLSWIAKQPWCTGKIGMMGISWGGFSALQIAARRHPNLQAIISLCSTDNRYTDDVHYMGGSMLSDNFQWSAMMFGMMSRAPDKKLLGKNWKSTWLNRLKHQPLMATRWMQHQQYDAYWKHGSISEDWSAIQCPVYLIGGWSDGYANTIPRMLESLQCPRKGLIGPWAHHYPHFSLPGPQIDFLNEAVRWWDKWLKGVETGIMQEPMYRAWMQESVLPASSYESRPGRWIAEESCPSQNIKPHQLFLTDDRKLSAQSSKPSSLISNVSPQSVGETAGTWCGYGFGPEKPTDQRIDDARSICCDSEPLAKPVEIFGSPLIELDLTVDKPDAFIAVRLNEVFPSGASTRISYGILNLTHRLGHENIMPINVGEKMHVSVQLKNIAHAFSKGNRIRVAISTSYWPLIWPSPEVVALSIFAGKSCLSLPVRSPRAKDKQLAAFGEAMLPPSLAVTCYRPAAGNRHIERDLSDNTVKHVVEEDWGDEMIDDINLRTDYKQKETYTIRDDDPLSASINIDTNITISRGHWKTRTEMHSVMRADEKNYLLQAKLSAYENDKLLLSRQWDKKIPRQNVSGSLNLFSKGKKRKHGEIDAENIISARNKGVG
jgi:putative CocE/NonD family hydrolase